MMNTGMDPAIEMLSGCVVHYLYPHPDQIKFRDIVQGLARAKRFNGQTKGQYGYSVAQHSVWVAMTVQEMFDADDHTVMLALLHDAHEAYTGDLVSPFKYIPEVKRVIKPIEERLQAVIYKALGIAAPNEEQRLLISHVDLSALAIEAYHLVPSRGKGWDLPISVQASYDSFRPALPEDQANELFWMAKNFIDGGIRLEELWRSI